MIKKVKRNVESDTKIEVEAPKKKPKLEKPTTSNLKIKNEKIKKSKGNFPKEEKSVTFGGTTELDWSKKKPKLDSKNEKPKENFSKQVGNSKPNKLALTEKPEDWGEYKKKMKELKVKRKQSRGPYDIIMKAKQISEKIRKKNLPGGKEEREKLVNDLHKLLSGKGNYSKFVLAHDTARIVQYLLKFGSEAIRKQIADELTPATMEMLNSTYGRFCVKRMLKYGNAEIRSRIIRAMYGHAIKLTTHNLSAPIFEYAFSTWASPKEKQHLVQEFYGDIYKQSKDDKVKHIRDVYANSPDLKVAALNATKTNITKVLNKNLLDSSLLQTVVYQFLAECKEENRAELIAQLSPHVVILSNSKDGAKVAMHCISRGTNKDKKTAMKALKQHVIELSKHEHGHWVIISVFDAIDDTVLVHKIILEPILENAQDLAGDEWGRKVLLWLVAPGAPTYFHPTFLKELATARQFYSGKKPTEQKSKELLEHSSSILLDSIASDVQKWLSNASIGIVTLAILKSGSEEHLKKVMESLVDLIANPEWKITENDQEIPGIEHAGLHMVLKKLAQHDQEALKKGSVTFGEVLLERIPRETLKTWIKCNRGCFVLVALFENGSGTVQNLLKEKLAKCVKGLKKQESQGAKILCQKLLS